MKSKKNIHGFSNPSDYFDKLEDRILHEIKMEKLPKETGMCVPEGYFEQLESRIVQKSTKKTPKIVKINTWWLAVAAACSILFVLWIVPNESQKANIPQDFAEIDISLEHYIEDILFDMPDSSTFYWIEDADIESSFNDRINKKEIEEYLMENLDFHTLLSYE